MCTTSIVRFRFSLKDNLTNSQTLNLNNKTKTIESESQFLSNLENIRSIRSTIGVKSSTKLITETLNMSKGLSNGHQLNDNIIDNTLNNNSDINSISATSSCIPSITTNTSSSCSAATVSACEATMGLSNASTKESLTQHLLLNSLKSGKPENGQRIDLTNISWTDLKNNCNKSNDFIQNQTNSETNDRHLENNCLPQNSPLNDQTVDQMIEEVLNKSESQVSEELTAQPMLETNTCEDPQQTQTSSAPQLEDNSNKTHVCEASEVSGEDTTNTQSVDVKEQQLSLIRQTERLIRRLRRLQFTQNHKHFAKQMKAFVENQQKVLGVGCQRQTESAVTPIPHLQSYSNPVEERMKLLTPEGVKGLSTSALVNLVKRLGSTASPNEGNHLQDFCPQQSPVRAQPQPPSFTSTPHPIVTPQVPQIASTPTQQLPNCGEESTLVKLLEKNHSQPSVPQQLRATLEEKEAIVSTIDSLSANLRHFESGFDSDATESSSGGESCDEFEDYSQDSVPQHSTPIQSVGQMFPMRKRSCWKWCVERAAIASRWTWLQAQVADLEFRIRQQNEMYRQLRATKGLISFGTADHNLTVPTPNVQKANSSTIATTSTTTSAPNNSSAPTQQSVTSSEGLAPVGTHPQQPQQTTSSESESHNCMRTLPLNSMRKRKLVRSMSALSGATRKAAKYSTIQCSCNGLPDIVWPCVLCNGRYSYVHVIDTDCMPLFERIALLDSSCHSVLSLNNDVSLGLHFTELLKRETIQRPIPSRHLNKKRKSPPSPTLANKFIFDSTKNKSPKRSQSVISSTKLKKKYDGSSKRRYVRRSGVSGDNVWRKRGRPRERVSSGSSRTESPIPSPVPSDGSGCGNSLSAPLHRRRRSEQHAFDINNIVIPYSIAATTRVEKLQYKEIITPKWRVVDSFEDKFNFSQFIKTEVKAETKPVVPKIELDPIEDEDEDITETAFVSRHAKCEEEERKRILTFMKGNTTTGSMRGRGARVRFDSTRSDTNASTGGDGAFHNTDSTSQDSYTGPSTPMVTPNCNDSSIPETPPPVTERKRNASLSSRRDDSIDEYFESVAPFDLRAFPLNDIEYELLSKDTQTVPIIEDNLESVNDPEKSNEGTITANNSRAPTPIDSDGAESVVEPTDEVDNDEDPEWEPKKL